MKRFKGGVFVVLCGIGVAAHAAQLPQLRLYDEQGRPVSQAVAIIENAVPRQPVASPGTAIMDQADLQFVPQVIAIRRGTQVEFPNSDDTRHHVYSFSDAKSFELQLYRGNQAPPVVFEKAGLVVVGCNIHDSMRGYIFVADNALHGVSDAEGAVTLPPFEARGKARLTLWHPRMNQSISMPVTDLTAEGGGHSAITLPFTLPDPAPKSEGSNLRNRLQRYNNDGN